MKNSMDRRGPSLVVYGVAALAAVVGLLIAGGGYRAYRRAESGAPSRVTASACEAPPPVPGAAGPDSTVAVTTRVASAVAASGLSVEAMDLSKDGTTLVLRACGTFGDLYSLLGTWADDGAVEVLALTAKKGTVDCPVDVRITLDVRGGAAA